jgi:hypothetical protein
MTRITRYLLYFALVAVAALVVVRLIDRTALNRLLEAIKQNLIQDAYNSAKKEANLEYNEAKELAEGATLGELNELLKERFGKGK